MRTYPVGGVMLLGGFRALMCGFVSAVVLWTFVAVFIAMQGGFGGGKLALCVLLGLGFVFYVILGAQYVIFVGDEGGRLETTADARYLFVILCRTAGVVCTCILLTTWPSTGPSVVSGLQLLTRLVIWEGLAVSVLGYGVLWAGLWVQERAMKKTTIWGAKVELALCGLLLGAYALLACILSWHLDWLFRVGGRFGWGVLFLGPIEVVGHPLAGALVPQVLDTLVSSPLVVDPYVWVALVFWHTWLLLELALVWWRWVLAMLVQFGRLDCFEQEDWFESTASETEIQQEKQRLWAGAQFAAQNWLLLLWLIVWLWLLLVIFYGCAGLPMC